MYDKMGPTNSSYKEGALVIIFFIKTYNWKIKRIITSIISLLTWETEGLGNKTGINFMILF